MYRKVSVDGKFQIIGGKCESITTDAATAGSVSLHDLADERLANPGKKVSMARTFSRAKGKNGIRGLPRLDWL